MYKSIGVIELKNIPKGVEATDAALKSAGVDMVASHPSCPGKYEIILTGSISNVTAAVDHVLSKFEGYVIDSSVMGRIDEQVIKALFGTQTGEKKGSLGLIETYSAATCIKAADIAVKTSRVEIFDLLLFFVKSRISFFWSLYILRCGVPLALLKNSSFVLRSLFSCS